MSDSDAALPAPLPVCLRTARRHCYPVRSSSADLGSVADFHRRLRRLGCAHRSRNTRSEMWAGKVEMRRFEGLGHTRRKGARQ